MRTTAVALLLTLALSTGLMAQEARPFSVQVHTLERGLPSATLEYNREAIELISAARGIGQASPVGFTALAVGWSSDGSSIGPTESAIRFRSKGTSGTWTDWKVLRQESSPSETPSGLSWSELALTADGVPQTDFELEFSDGFLHSATMIRVILVNATDGRRSQFPQELKPDSAPLDLKPEIVPRSSWWGNLPAEYLNPTTSAPQYISITHAVVHHTAGMNNPPDPAQDVRGIWYYHVFGQGWSDIAYNFLIDQHGTVYHGRYNPYIDLLDVRGSHASYANNQSVGVALLGSFGVVTPPTPAAVQSLTRVLAWRFKQKHLDPLSRADMIRDDAGNTVNLYRISGHRDVSPTECPGEALYFQLATIRQTARTLVQSDDSAAVPGSFFLAQNYPNPFNPATTIEYSVPEAGHVILVVHDILGQQVSKLVDAWQSPGPHSTVFDGATCASGTYVYTLVQGSRVSTRRMILIR